MKKAMYAALTALFLLIMVGCDEVQEQIMQEMAQAPEDMKKVLMVFPEEPGDNPFFTQMTEGIAQAESEQLAMVSTVIAEHPENIEQMLRIAMQAKFDLIITSTFMAEDALEVVAKEFPQQQFAIIDTIVDAPNVKSVTFNEQEASYLLGVAAGRLSQSKTIGIVAAKEIDLLNKYTSGFAQGLKSVEPESELLIDYVGSFSDPVKAKQLAEAQFAKGADFIVPISGIGDIGVFEAAKEQGFLTTGQDVDYTERDPERIVLSQLKQTDAVVYNLLQQLSKDELQMNNEAFGLKEGAVGLTYVTHDGAGSMHPRITPEIIAELLEVATRIENGEIDLTAPDLSK